MLSSSKLSSNYATTYSLQAWPHTYSQADAESVHRTLQVNNTDSDSSQQSFYPTVVSEKKFTAM